MVKIGFGSRIVSPPDGVGLIGYFEKRISKGIKDDLYARCMCFEDGGNPVFIISTDFCWIELSVVEKVISLIEERMGIKNPGVVIHATHTHTGPLTGLNRELVFTKKIPVNERYLEELPLMIYNAVEESYRSRQNVLIGFANIDVPGISFIRRYRMKNGMTITNPVDRTRIIKPAGEIDRTLGVMKVTDEKGKLFCVAVNFVLHPDTIGGDFVSGDWPGMLFDRISKNLGCNAIFFNGAAGDINHINPYDSNTRSIEITEKIVSTLFENTKKLTSDIECFPVKKVLFSQDIIEMPKRKISGEQIERARKDIQTYPHSNLRSIVARALLSQSEMMADFISNRVSFLTLDRMMAAFFLSGELFSSIGIKIKKMMNGFENRWVIENCDGHGGYIPDERAFRDAEENRKIRGEEEFPSVDVFESIGMEASYETSPIPCLVAPEVENSIISGFQKMLEKHTGLVQSSKD